MGLDTLNGVLCPAVWGGWGGWGEDAGLGFPQVSSQDVGWSRKAWDGPKEPRMVPKNLGWPQRSWDDPKEPRMVPKDGRCFGWSPRAWRGPQDLGWSLKTRNSSQRNLGAWGRRKKSPLGNKSCKPRSTGGPLVVDMGQDPRPRGGGQRLPAHRDWGPYPKPIPIPPRGVREAQGGLTPWRGGRAQPEHHALVMGSDPSRGADGISSSRGNNSGP